MIHCAACFPKGPASKEFVCKSPGDVGLIPGSGRSPEEGNGSPFQCSCLKKPMDRGAWRATQSPHFAFTVFRPQLTSGN